MKKALLALLSTSLFISTLSAADINATNTAAPVKADAIDTGWYIGLGLGAAGYSDGDMGKDFDNYEVQVDQKSNFGVKLYAGYKFNSIVAVEASYINYGSFSYKAAGSTTADVNTKVSPATLNVMANLGYDFLNDQLRPFALVGLGYVNFGQSSNPSHEVYSTDNGAALVIGTGLEYTPSIFHGIGFRFTIEQDTAFVVQSYDDPTKDDKTYANRLALISLGVNYKF